MAAIPLEERYEGRGSRSLAPVHDFPKASLLDRLEIGIRNFNGDYRKHLPERFRSMHEETVRKLLHHGMAEDAHVWNDHPVLGDDRIPYEILARTRDGKVAYVAKGGIAIATPSNLQWFMDHYIGPANPALYKTLCNGMAKARFSGEERNYPGRDVVRQALYDGNPSFK